jgi:hypothetical protein
MEASDFFRCPVPGNYSPILVQRHHTFRDTIENRLQQKVIFHLLSSFRIVDARNAPERSDSSSSDLVGCLFQSILPVVDELTSLSVGFLWYEMVLVTIGSRRMDIG